MENNESEEHDLLTCGNCQKEFILSDIVLFIEHKVNGCCRRDSGHCVSTDMPERRGDDDDCANNVFGCQKSNDETFEMPFVESDDKKRSPSLVSKSRRSDVSVADQDLLQASQSSRKPGADGRQLVHCSTSNPAAAANLGIF